MMSLWRLLALACVVALFSGSALAQDSKAAPAAAPAGRQGGNPLVMAVVDMNEVLRTAKAAKDIDAQLQARGQAIGAELQEEDRKLREADQELARQRTVLSPEAFKDERQKFEEKVNVVQRKMAERKNEIDQARAAAMEKVSNALKEIIADIVKEHGITLILRKEATVASDKQADISEVVRERLDKKLPAVKVFDGAAAKAPAKAPAAPAKGGK